MKEPTGHEPTTSHRFRDTSATERQTFKECRRSWLLQYGHRLGKAEGHPPFMFGQAMHEALAQFYESLKDGRTFKKASARALVQWPQAWKSQCDDVEEEIGKVPSYVKDAWAEDEAMGLNMLENYLVHEKDDPVVAEILEVERRFEVPILVKGRVIGYLSCQLDVLGRDEQGQLVVVDHKTASSKPNLNLLDMNDQMTAYIWGVRQETGEDVRIAIYNALLKKRTHPPAVLKNGTLSLNKQALVTYEGFREAITAHGLRINDYSEHLSWLRDNPPDLLVRDRTRRVLTQLDEWEANLVREITDMRRVAARPEMAYPSPSAMRCGSCAVQTICRTMMERGDHESIIRNGYRILPPRR